MKFLKSLSLFCLTLSVLFAPLGAEKASAAPTFTKLGIDLSEEISVTNSEKFEVTAYYSNNSSMNVNTEATVTLDNWQGQAEIKLTGVLKDEWKFTGLKAGRVTVDASYKEGSVTKTKSVTVKVRPAISISSYGNMRIGDTYQTESKLYLDASSPQKLTSGMTYSSSDPSVASISSTGFLKALKAGTTEIKVTHPDPVFGGTIESSYKLKVTQ